MMTMMIMNIQTLMMEKITTMTMTILNDNDEDLVPGTLGPGSGK